MYTVSPVFHHSRNKMKCLRRVTYDEVKCAKVRQTPLDIIAIEYKYCITFSIDNERNEDCDVI